MARNDAEEARQRELERAQREADARAREQARQRDLEQRRAAEAARRRQQAEKNK